MTNTYHRMLALTVALGFFITALSFFVSRANPQGYCGVTALVINQQSSYERKTAGYPILFYEEAVPDDCVLVDETDFPTVTENRAATSYPYRFVLDWFIWSAATGLLLVGVNRIRG